MGVDFFSVFLLYIIKSGNIARSYMIPFSASCPLTQPVHCGAQRWRSRSKAATATQAPPLRFGAAVSVSEMPSENGSNVSADVQEFKDFVSKVKRKPTGDVSVVISRKCRLSRDLLSRLNNCPSGCLCWLLDIVYCGFWWILICLYHFFLHFYRQISNFRKACDFWAGVTWHTNH